VPASSGPSGATGSARAEYDFIGLQNQSFTVAGMPAPGGFGGDTINVNNRNINMVTGGVNYEFGPWPWW
jgi:hypothetical protein